VWIEKLEEYEAKKEAGEDYPECPRCEGSRYESAVPYEHIDDIRPMVEEYPCPLCVTVATIDIDDALRWLRAKAEVEEE
jgi:hypothetical protein